MDGHLPSARVDEPALADAVLLEPRELPPLVIRRGSRREHFDDQIRRSPDLIPDDAKPIARHKNDVRLDDQRLARIKDHIDWRDTYLAQPANSRVLLQQERQVRDEALM